MIVEPPLEPGESEVEDLMIKRKPQFVRRYRIWYCPERMLWAVSPDHKDGKTRRHPFIYARTCHGAFNRLKKRQEYWRVHHAEREKNREKCNRVLPVPIP